MWSPEPCINRVPIGVGDFLCIFTHIRVRSFAFCEHCPTRSISEKYLGTKRHTFKFHTILVWIFDPYSPRFFVESVKVILLLPQRSSHYDIIMKNLETHYWTDSPKDSVWIDVPGTKSNPINICSNVISRTICRIKSLIRSLWICFPFLSRWFVPRAVLDITIPCSS